MANAVQRAFDEARVELDQLRAEDRDARKLRSRLAHKTAELDKANALILELRRKVAEALAGQRLVQVTTRRAP